MPGSMIFDLDEALTDWLTEDLGPGGLEQWGGDVTSRAMLTGDLNCRGRITTGAPCTVSGLVPVRRLFERAGVRVKPGTDEEELVDGVTLETGATIVELTGQARGILAVERLALNLLARSSGIATGTALVVSKVRAINDDIEVAATRKTAPGLRHLEKEAVVAGGAVPHRMGLFDAFLVKDNHLALMEGDGPGRVMAAVAACRARSRDLMLEVEADTVEQALAAAEAGADWVLLDNFSPGDLAKVSRMVRQRYPETRLEASGGITLQNVELFAPWVDRVSLGWLTQSAPAIPMSLHVRPLQ